ncbi:hypothetical protein SAMN02745134_01840 [Clostridium acidisoli DSM 12555]|uniref:Uncharacterized protein n=1 Tax=Clostridium acidisoli DSM 12555 TaxID=1121291 RepID=A0A1W1XGY6_9CLOT|nr:hypothetical protein [Clostridium acidisoli]SMC23255.1 hypothetical protein SAMN02745134_01840 [Clostridium acidisoli DSM 12555]
MKIKTLRNVAFGIGCLMLTLTLSLNLISPSTNGKSIHIIKLMQGSPYGMAKVNHVIKPMEGSPYGMVKSIHVIHTDVDMPNG